MSNKQGLPLILWIIIAAVGGGGIGFGVAYYLMTSSAKSASISLYPPTVREAGADWVVTIDDYAIPRAEFEEGYKMTIENITPEQIAMYGGEGAIKQMYLDNIVNTYAVAIRALDEGIMDSPENQALIAASVRDAISKLYLQTKLPTDPMAFMPTKIEEDQFFQQNKAEIMAMGLSSEQIRQMIQQQLSQRKLQMWMEQVLSQVKSEFKVKRNDEILGQLGISSALGGGALQLPSMGQ